MQDVEKGCSSHTNGCDGTTGIERSKYVDTKLKGIRKFSGVELDRNVYLSSGNCYMFEHLT